MGISAAIGIAALGAPALADPQKDEKGYEYVFKDDPMQAESMGATTAQIQVIKTGRRDRLLRPRLQFVTEMLKSVEAL